MAGVLGVAGPYGEVAVRDTGGEGPAIVLLHGNSSSSRAFERQLHGPLGKTCRLVAIDLMGHGQSADAADPAAYLLSGQARTLIAVATALGVTDAVFVGWSLGGHVVLEAAPDLAAARGFAIFGTPPIGFPPALGEAFLPHPAFGLGFAPTMTPEQAQAYAQSQVAPGYTDIPPFAVDDILRTDGRARQGVAASLDPSVTRDEIEVVAGLTKPLAILHGEREQLINGAYLAALKAPTLWRGAVEVIAHAGHSPQWETPAAFDAALQAFARDCG